MSALQKVPFLKSSIICIGLIAALWLAMPYILFIFNFSTNICYSDVVSDITDLSVSVANSSSIEKKQTYSDLAKKLPLYGYETDCGSLKLKVNELIQRVNEAGYKK